MMDRKPVKDIELSAHNSVSELVEQFAETGGFLSVKINKASKIIKDMNAKKCTKFLSFPANVIATGTRGAICTMIDRDLVDVIITTCGTLDHDLAIVYEPLLPNGLTSTLVDFGFDLLKAPKGEFEASHGLSLNVLATAPREVIAIIGFPETHQLMSEAGCSISLFDADDLCIPCEGGPPCLTRPILRV